MNFIQHSDCNDVLAAPPGVRIEDCRALPIRRITEVIDGGVIVPAVQSFWMPSPEEAAAIAAGHPIIFTVWGSTHPPIRLEVAASKE